MMSNLDSNAHRDGTYFKFCITMVYLSSTIYPFVFLINYQDYHRALRAFCLKQKPVERDVQSTGVVSMMSSNTSNRQ